MKLYFYIIHCFHISSVLVYWTAYFIYSGVLYGTISASTVEWKADEISVSHNYHTKGNSLILNITARANGPLFNDGFGLGHFQLKYGFLYDGRLSLHGITDCISFTADSSAQIKQKLLKSTLSLSNSSPTSSQLFGKYYSVLVQKFYNDFGSTKNTNTGIVLTFVKVFGNTTRLTFDVVTQNCTALRTFGLWNDGNRWKGGVVPTKLDTVVFPSKSGVIQLEESVAVTSLRIFGGTIKAYTSGCPQSWTLDDRFLHAEKCYKLFDEPMIYNDAAATCHKVAGAGSLMRNLVQISDRNELDLVYRLCRPTNVGEGCWIGLRDPKGSGDFRWIIDEQMENSNAAKLFLDWRRSEPSNHTVSEGMESLGGERCAATIPWIEDALLEEQGGWNDDSCFATKPFVCQAIVDSIKFKITLFDHLQTDGGALEGGEIEIGKKATKIGFFSLIRGARLMFPVGGNATIENLEMSDGAKLFNNGYIQLVGGEIGERNVEGAQSVIEFGATSTIKCVGKVHLKAKVYGKGILSVFPGADLQLHQGGLLSQASVDLLGHSALTLAGYASRLSTWDSFELILTHRGPLAGEYYGKDVIGEYLNKHEMISKGVYRLKLSVGTAKEISDCIPYNATAKELTNILRKINLVDRRGGVTVRRYGNQNDLLYAYGFTYRIELDAASTAHFKEGPLEVSFYCYGLSCGCADTKVTVIASSGLSLCPNPSNYSHLEVDTCVIPPSVGISRISTLSYLSTKGTGEIKILDGSHRLMPISNVGVSILSGTGIVAASVIQWSSLDVANIGNLIISGTGWAGWDSSYLLFSPNWNDQRGLFSYLSNAPPAIMSAQYFSVTDGGRVVTTGPGTKMYWASGKWDGGIIGGESDLYIIDKISLAGAHKALRYGITVHINDSAVATWTNGNITLANGARVLVRGIFNVTNSDSNTTIVIGEAHLLKSSSIVSQNLMIAEPGRNWQSYFDRLIASELRPAWYTNPLCGDKCLLVNELYIEGHGQIVTDADSNSLFLLPLNIVGTSKFNVGKNAKVNLGSGGIFGNDVVVDLSVGTTLELSGGRMKMEATCTIKGAGELIVTAGSHDLSFSVDAHITISGGTLVWPESRGTQKTITFNGGLLIQGTGQLEVQPFSTTILVHDEVRLKDESIIQFPLIGIAAQASPFDRSDAPDTSPRGNLTATGTMRWEGGTLKGKADFNALKELFLDGQKKYIKSLAKLVNKGHCEWGNGDIITSDNGDFQNFGTIQMRDGVADFFSSMMYKGSELPVDNGGDYFALEFHSWDTDNGALDYSEYLQLRTRFVSRVPNDWTFESQK